MARGLPDYGQQAEQYAIAGMADLGEAVARLGSINVFDRRGFTVWQDDFEAPVLRWTGARGGVGVAPVLDTTRAFSGIQCVYMNCPAGVGAYSRLTRVFPLIRLGKVGAEFWVQGFTDGPTYFSLQFDVYDGADHHRAELRLYTFERRIDIIHTLGTTTVVTLLYMSPLNWYFLPIKLVIDMDSAMYVRLLVGEREINLSTYALVRVGGTGNRYITAQFDVVSGTLTDGHMYLDDFILTQNEP